MSRAPSCVLALSCKILSYLGDDSHNDVTALETEAKRRGHTRQLLGVSVKVLTRDMSSSWLMALRLDRVMSWAENSNIQLVLRVKGKLVWNKQPPVLCVCMCFWGAITQLQELQRNFSILSHANSLIAAPAL